MKLEATTTCDPLTLGALAIGAAGTAANSIGQANAASQQEAEYARWAETQKQNRAAENVRQEELRQRAEASRQTGVEQLSAETQKSRQDTESTRLAALLNEEAGVKAQPTATTPTSAADAALSGMEYGGDVFRTDLAAGLADAAASAKQRIGAMANAQSFGNSWGGLGTVNQLALGESGRGIDAANAFRRGSLGAYQTEQAVDPTEVLPYSDPIADIAQSFLGAGMQGVGSMAAGGSGLGSGISSIFKTAKIPSSAGLSAASPWTGLF